MIDGIAAMTIASFFFFNFRSIHIRWATASPAGETHRAANKAGSDGAHGYDSREWNGIRRSGLPRLYERACD
ncbi:hypothetical protein [Bradyrhizobium sp. Leo121]|uniref:hypothetical protein n=1 Tax=Bradyrhizobium sp. Leo121 TaxID=1571195 RepID=UPI0010295C7A|nr:hypothetical protein [Bradyrhizobium sp. Leo121]